MTQSSLRFDGPDIRAEDAARLGRQLDAVRELMSDHAWRTHRQIAAVVGGSENGVAARLRDLRKKKFGGHLVERRRVPGTLGLFQYRVLSGGAS